MSSLKELRAIVFVFVGCCSNVVFLELLINYDKGAGNIITFAQFLLIAVEGLVFQSKFFTVKPVIPIRKYFIMVLMFFAVSVVNNYALNFNIPLPLHMIFRSGSLVANMALNILILRKKYPASKYFAVAMITIGIILATQASTAIKKKVVEVVEKDDLVVEVEDDQEEMEDGSGLKDLVWIAVGVFMLTFTLFMSAAMGIYQEVLYQTHGKHPNEARFYSHALPLPWFLIFYSDLSQRVTLFNQSDPVSLLGIVVIPIMWIYLLMDALSQYLCIVGVFTLTTECPSLVVTLIITLRKFVSLIFSILYFQNTFTSQHWLATVLVFTGTILFSGIIQTAITSMRQKQSRIKQE